MALPEILPLSKVDPTVFKNPREKRTAEATAELLASLREHGQIEPVVVGMTPGKDGRYPLIAGWGRFDGLTTMKAAEIKVTYAPDVKKARLLALAENEHRSQLHTSELASAVGELEKDGAKQKEIARSLCKSEGYISQLLSVYHSPFFQMWKKAVLEADDATRARMPGWHVARQLVQDYSEKAKPDMSPEERQKRMVAKMERLIENAKKEPEEVEEGTTDPKQPKTGAEKLPERIREWYKEALKVQKTGIRAADETKLDASEMAALAGAVQAIQWAFKVKKVDSPVFVMVADEEE